MTITLETATVATLDEVTETVAGWQVEGGPVQLHPGDLGWLWRMGGLELAAALRVWRRGEEILAVGLVDGPGLIRMGVAPSADEDEVLAEHVVSDLSDPARGALPVGDASVEARYGAALRERLDESGWSADESWTPLCRHLADRVEDCGLRVEVVDPHRASARVAVHRAAFPTSTFTVERWHTMAATLPYRRARCLLGYDAQGDAVAAVTVWSAGAGRPGLLEPMGVHHDHRGRGYGRAICVAAAATLRELGATSATVCTPSSNVGGVATYASAGFQEQPAVTDFRRPASQRASEPASSA